MIKKKCKICGKEFEVLPYRKDTAKYCSFKCYWKSLKGKSVSPKTGFKKGQVGYWNGKKRPNMVGKKNGLWKGGPKKVHCRVCGKEVLRYPSELKNGRIIFCSCKCKAKYYLAGKKPWNYRGISSENERIRHGIEYNLWREAVFARDNYTCQKCDQSGGKLRAHHMFNFSTYLDLRFAIDNGITLCKKCHKEFHKIYGSRNNTKEQLIEFLCSKKVLEM